MAAIMTQNAREIDPERMRPIGRAGAVEGLYQESHTCRPPRPSDWRM